MSYNGWKNRETWNVALWIGNDEGLYRNAVEYAKINGEDATYKEFVTLYIVNIDNGLEPAPWVTPDGVLWLDPSLDYERLDEMIREFGED